MPKVSEVYKKLYHYTTWEGLQGILETQALWATRYGLLNDYTEIVLFRDKLISFIKPLAHDAFEELIRKFPHIEQKINDEGGMGQVVQHEAEVVVDAQYKALGDEIFILSFCGEHENDNINNHGLLSQWRGYGAGGGASLVFDTKKLEDIIELEVDQFQYSHVHIADLIYSDDDQKFKEELSDDLSIIAGVVSQFYSQVISGNNNVDVFLKGYHPFVNCISRYKHFGFSEENEVRVVALPTAPEELKQSRAKDEKVKTEKEIKYRQKNGQNIPYIELFSSSDIELPIEKIIIGPHKDKDARATEISEKLAKTNIEITCSEIPFVG